MVTRCGGCCCCWRLMLLLRDTVARALRPEGRWELATPPAVVATLPQEGPRLPPPPVTALVMTPTEGAGNCSPLLLTIWGSRCRDGGAPVLQGLLLLFAEGTLRRLLLLLLFIMVETTVGGSIRPGPVFSSARRFMASLTSARTNCQFEKANIVTVQRTSTT